MLPAPTVLAAETKPLKLLRSFRWGSAKSQAHRPTPGSVPPALQAVTCQPCSAGVAGRMPWAHGADAGFACCVSAVFIALFRVSSFLPLSPKGLATGGAAVLAGSAASGSSGEEAGFQPSGLRTSQCSVGWRPCVECPRSKCGQPTRQRTPFLFCPPAAELHGDGGPHGRPCESLLAGPPSRPGGRLAGGPWALDSVRFPLWPLPNESETEAAPGSWLSSRGAEDGAGRAGRALRVPCGVWPCGALCCSAWGQRLCSAL